MAFLAIFGAELAAVALVTVVLFRCLKLVRRLGNAVKILCLSARPDKYAFLRPSSHWRSTFHPPAFSTPTLSGLILLCVHVLALTARLSQPLRQAIDNRAAQAAVISLPLLLASSTHKNALACMAGVSHLDVSFLHVCLGYLIAVESAVHVALHFSPHRIGWFAYLAFVTLILLIVVTALPVTINALNIAAQVRALFRLSNTTRSTRGLHQRRVLYEVSKWWRPMHAGLGFVFLVLVGLHVATPLRYFVIAAAAITVMDNLLITLQKWRLRIPGAALQWAECVLESHRCCTVVCVGKHAENVNIGYDLVNLNVPATSLGPGSFFYLHSGWRSRSGPLQLLWYDEENGDDIVLPDALRAQDGSLHHEMVNESPVTSITRKNNLFFLIRRRDAESHVKFLNRCTSIEGPYKRRQALQPGNPADVTWLFAADDGIILALSYVKHLWARGISLKLNLYTTNTALLAQIRLFYVAKVQQYLPLSQTKWIYSPAFSKQLFPEPQELYFEIRENFGCERDLAEARDAYPRLRVITAGNAAFRDRLRAQCQNGSQILHFEEI